MLVLDYNSVNAVGRVGKRKATVVEDARSREEKKARQVNQLLIEVSIYCLHKALPSTFPTPPPLPPLCCMYL
jgi:hypothetical protein